MNLNDQTNCNSFAGVIISFDFSSEKKDHILDNSMVQSVNEFGQPVIKRQRMTPPLNERVMLYVRQDNEDVYTPLHVVPPTTIGLLNAVSASNASSPFQ